MYRGCWGRKGGRRPRLERPCRSVTGLKSWSVSLALTQAPNDAEVSKGSRVPAREDRWSGFVYSHCAQGHTQRCDGLHGGSAPRRQAPRCAFVVLSRQEQQGAEGISVSMPACSEIDITLHRKYHIGMMSLAGTTEKRTGICVWLLHEQSSLSGFPSGSARGVAGESKA